MLFQSTRPARGATIGSGEVDDPSMVSIHAPRAGRDPPPAQDTVRNSRFNPRAPRGARQASRRGITRPLEFQSTRPARGATDEPGADVGRVLFQSTRPARGATVGLWRREIRRHVSIHAPRAGRDGGRYAISVTGRVSIHAPRAGRDNYESAKDSRRKGFNPRAPRGARLWRSRCLGVRSEFQSTRPARGATE